MPFFYYQDPESAARTVNGLADQERARPLVLIEEDGKRIPLRLPRKRRFILATAGTLVAGFVLCLSSWQSGRSTSTSVAGSRAEHVADEDLQAFGFHRKEKTIYVDRNLELSRAVYNQEVAEAFAALTKVSYCGPLPGIYSAVALTCSILQIPGSTSVCERANFNVVPGYVAALQASDSYAPDAVFAYMAKVAPGSIENRTQTTLPGVLIAFRGSIDNFANSARDKETRLGPAGEKCKGCKLHTGYSTIYDLLSSQMETYLKQWGCGPVEEENPQPAAGADDTGVPPLPQAPKEPCTVYVTGHGSGAAVAQIAMLDLAHRGYRVGVSYLFSSPMVGDQSFAASMNAQFRFGRHGPVFQVVDGKESAARWPYDDNYQPWGVQAYFGDMTKKRPTVICYSSDPLCGINVVAKEDLTHQHVCESALAPGKSFCDFGKDFAGSCYGGMSFEILDTVREEFEKLQAQAAPSEAAKHPGEHGKRHPASPFEPQPVDQAAEMWHPSQSDGEQANALAAEAKHGVFARSNPHHFFSMDTLRAMATFSKIAYCGSSPGLQNTVVSSCTGKDSICHKAGFGVVPHSVVPENVPGYGNDEAVFFYTALLRRTSHRFAEAPHFMPAESCVVVFRGTANAEDEKIGNDLHQVGLHDPECPGCTVNRGINQMWDYEIQKRLIPALDSSGCSARHPHAKTNKVVVTGHSMGGTLATLAAYKLHKLGFDVQLSWSLEGGRPGNAAFLDHINHKMFANQRGVPMWLVTNENDGIARWPKEVGGKSAGRLMYHVHFDGKEAHPTICATAKGATQDGRCGIFKYDYKDLVFKAPNKANCHLPYAPQGQMCMVTGVPRPLPYAMANQCNVGGAMHQ